MDWRTVIDGLALLGTIIGTGASVSLAFVNTKFEALRESWGLRWGELVAENKERKECTRHIEASVRALAEEHHTLEKTQVRLAAEISRTSGSVEHIATAIRDQGMDLKKIEPLLAAFGARLASCEDKFRAIKFFYDAPTDFEFDGGKKDGKD